MPRGKPGTGPYARKRLQNALSVEGEVYMRLPLTENETRAVYYTIQRNLANGWGREDAMELQNVVYRITEHVAALKLGLPMKMAPHEYAGLQKVPQNGIRKPGK